MTLVTIVSRLISEELRQPVLINVDSPTLEDNTTTSVQSETVLRRYSHVNVKIKKKTQNQKIFKKQT